MPSVAEVIADVLEAAGVKVVFGIPSVHNIGFYDVLRNRPGIQHILCRHEVSATQMADGYSRSGKGLGVIISSTGPGASLTASPLLEAYYSCSPVLSMTSNIPVHYIGQGKGTLHEFNQQDVLFKEITKKTYCVRSTDNVKAQVEDLVQTALTGRQGPIYLEIPVNFWGEEVTGDAPAGASPIDKSVPDLAAAVHLLARAKRPMIIAGIEAVRANLGETILKIADALQAPVMTDTNAKGLIPEDHPLSFGVTVARGVPRELQKTADATLSIGCRLRQNDHERRSITMPNLIHIDWDNTWVNKNYSAEVSLIGDVEQIVVSLTDALKSESLAVDQAAMADMMKRQKEELANWDRTDLEAKYVDAIRNVLPRDGKLVGDSTILAYIAERAISSYIPGGVIMPKGSSAIGFAFPAAIGLKLAEPETPVVALTGDGGFLYATHDLAACVRHKVNFPLIVINDGAYRMIDWLQDMNFKQGYETELLNPDFMALAKAYGVSGVSVDSPESLEQALEKSLASGKMELIEVKAKFPNPPFMKF